MDNPRFELVIQVRDNQGNLTGRTKSFSSDHASDIEEFWNKNKYEQTRRHRTKRDNNEIKGTDGLASET